MLFVNNGKTATRITFADPQCQRQHKLTLTLALFPVGLVSGRVSLVELTFSAHSNGLCTS